MPPPAVLLVAPHVAFHISRQAVMTGMSDAAVAYVLGRLAWRSIPSWIRDDVSIKSLFLKRSLSSSKDDDQEEQELGSLASVLEKIQALLTAAAERLSTVTKELDSSDEDETTGEVKYLQATIIAYLHLACQFRKLYPEEMTRMLMPAAVSGQRHDDRRQQQPKQRIACPYEWSDLKECLDFAVAAYETDTDSLSECLGCDFEILEHNSLLKETVRPGFVGHFLAVSELRKCVVVAVRGTSSLEEMLTDCCGGAVDYTSNMDDDGEACIEVLAAQPNAVQVSVDGQVEIVSGHERICIDHGDDGEYAIRCHDGILACAKRLAACIHGNVDTYVTRKGYRLLLCGHSLGAGVASLTALVLRSQIPSLMETGSMQVVAFAPPPVLDHDSAVATSSYTVSVVNQSDVIPRMSLVNMTVFLEFLRTVSTRLHTRGLAPTNPTSTLAFLRKLMRMDEKEDELLMSLDEVKQAFQQAHQRIQVRDPDHLYVAGRVLLLVKTAAAKQPDIDDARDDDNNELFTLECVETDGATSMLRGMEVDLFRMVTDHVTNTYYENLNQLIAESPW